MDERRLRLRRDRRLHAAQSGRADAARQHGRSEIHDGCVDPEKLPQGMNSSSFQQEDISMKSRYLFRTACLGLMLGAVAAVGAAQAAEPLKVGLLEDVSGDLALFGIPKLHGSQLAVEEINKSGGILGRQIELIHLDPQGDNARYQEFARRLLSKDKVDVLIGGITSASREAIWPII